MTSTTTTSQCEPIVYDPMHKILDVDLDRLQVGLQISIQMMRCVKPLMEKNRRYFSETCLRVAGGWRVRRGGSSTYKKPWPVVIVDSIPLQRNNSDCGVFTIKYFEYIAASVDLDTLCQENMSYFIKQLAFQLWTNTPMY
ncbi:hypothetical protein IC575_027818 [Cucumis melo]